MPLAALLLDRAVVLFPLPLGGSAGRRSAGVTLRATGFSILPYSTIGHTYFSRSLGVFPTFLRFAQIKHPVFVHIATSTRSGASAGLLSASPLRGIREHPLFRTKRGL